jgi:hypothetical protein
MSSTGDEVHDPAGARRRTLTDVLTELACRDVLVAFCRAVDDGRPDDAARLFTENCSVEMGGPPVTGRESVRSALAGRPSGRRTLHTTGTTTVQVTGPDSATASSVIVTYVLADSDGTADGIPRRISAVTDQFARSADDCWLIAQRRTRDLTAQVSTANRDHEG